MHKTADFRNLLAEPGPVVLGGAYDGLSACLTEQAGFDAVWASGFCISTSKRVADVGLLTMTELLSAAADINKATSLPVIADVDDGFGDAINVVRMVQEYEAAGIAGICIEDNQHPKRNSLHDGLRSKLVTLEEFSAKLRAAKAAQTDPDFVVIARTEALIADEGMDAARRRATAYAEAGADMIVIHSRAAEPDDIRDFGMRWSGDVPLVAIPTTYAHVTVAELYGYGYKMAIFANQALRAAVRAMQATLQSMMQAQTPSSPEADLASLNEIFTLAGFEEVRELESRFISGVRPHPPAAQQPASPTQTHHAADTP